MNEPTSKTTSVIVVTYHTGPALWVCLFRLLQMKGLHEIIVVNNGNDAAVEIHLAKLAKKHAAIQIVTGQGNVGFATACNLGAQKATGDYVLLLNPDAVLMESDAFSRFISVLEKTDANPPVGLVGGVLRNEDGSEQRTTRRNIMTPQNMLLEGLGLHKIKAIPVPPLNITGELPAQPEPVPALSGACMMMERERYVQMRGMDENYFLHVEDMDFCKRVHDAGGDVWINPQVNILHYCSTSEVSNLFVERMKTKGFYRYYQLHFYSRYIWRGVIDIAITARLAAKILASFFENTNARLVVKDALGLRRVQAIVRGVEGSLEQIRNKLPAPLPAGSTVLVTGATSDIGLFAIGRLLAYGCKVVAVKHRTLVGFFHPNLKWIDGDVSNPQTIAAALGQTQCDYALNCAPIWHSAGLAYVLQSVGVKRLTAISSASVLTPEALLAPQERSKIERMKEGESSLTNETLAVGIGATILRPTMVYGAGLDEGIMHMVRTIDTEHHFTLPKEATGLRAPVHADDVAMAAINALASDAAANRTYTLQGGTVMPYHAMVTAIFRIMGLTVKLRPIPNLAKLCGFLHSVMPAKFTHPAKAQRMEENLVFPDEQALKDLNIAPRPFLQGGAADLGICEEEICRSLLPA